MYEARVICIWMAQKLPQEGFVKFQSQNMTFKCHPHPRTSNITAPGQKRQLLIEMFSFAVQQFYHKHYSFNNTCTWKTSTVLSRPCYTVAVWPLIENNFSLFNQAQYVVHCIHKKIMGRTPDKRIMLRLLEALVLQVLAEFSSSHNTILVHLFNF